MLMRLGLFIGLIVAGLTAASGAQAERRVALVIGNSNYVHASNLRNPRHDAAQMAETLKKLGFEVHIGLDLDQQKFARSMDEFARALDGADVALFFYAGHGLQINDKNYLVSVNAQLANEFLVSAETIELDSVIRLMESKVAINLVFLDACRNNPLAEDLRKNLAALKRSAVLGRGLARVEPSGRDTLVAFAAAPGQEAADGNLENSPFTTALLKHIPTPGLEVSVMLKEVAADVRKATRNAQRPQQLSDMSRTFYFAKAEPAVARLAAPAPNPAPIPAVPQGQARSDDRALEVAFWNAAQSANECDATRAYLQRFPNGIFVELARLAERRLCSGGRRIDVIGTAPGQAPQAGAAGSAAPPPPPGPAIAALPAPTEAAPSAPTAADIVRPIQLELVRLGCNPGNVDGKWGAGSREAAQKFRRNARVSISVDEPSPELLAALQGEQDRVCPLECGRGYRAKGGVCIAVERPAPPRRVREVERRRQRPDAHAPAYAPRHAAPARPAPKEEEPYTCTIDLGYGRTAPCHGGGR